MGNGIEKAQLKAWLLHDVAYLCRRADRRWNAPIVRTLHDLREMRARAVFFGGTLRSLLLARADSRRMGRPRDIDIVVEGITVEALRKTFRSLVTRETRFGGLQLQRRNWQFDVWPLHRTWAFIEDSSIHPSFASLPSTTFFNLEAIAVDAWAAPGYPRMIYSGDDRFFDGILSRTLEINREENPFTALCVVRALVMASADYFLIGPRLARFLANHGPKISDADLEETQRKHYGDLRFAARTMRRWIDHVRRSLDHGRETSVALPRIPGTASQAK